MSRKGNEDSTSKKKGEKEEDRRAISPWQPEDYMAAMDRMFTDFERRIQSGFSPFADFVTMPRPRWWFEAPDVRHPYADLVDSGNEYRVVAEVPGIPKDKLDITVTPTGVMIKGEAKTDTQEKKEGEGFVRRERSYTQIERSLSFPEEVLADRAEASLNNGLLEIRAPKKTPTDATAHKVQIA